MNLNLGPENYSPALLEKIIYAGSIASFAQAAEHLQKLADMNVGKEDVRKFTVRIGSEMASVRDEMVEQFNAGQLETTVPDTPSTVAVSVDGGRAQLREEDAGRGVFGNRWSEPRYASFRSISSEPHQSDPHVEVPRAFLSEAHVRAIASEVKGQAKKTSRKKPPASQPDESKSPPESKDEARQVSEYKAGKRIKVLVQTCVAATGTSDEFGAVVGAEATRRRFYQAAHKAFLGDGLPSNWSIFKKHFSDWTAILDFIHLLAYLFGAANAAIKSDQDAWVLYVELVTAAWQGQTERVIEMLRQEAERLGAAPKNAKENDPRKIVGDALRYVTNNSGRMNYPEYRRQGVPITTCNIESLIKQFNMRVKASDKFWVEPCLDAVLQVRAAHLSNDDRRERFWSTRAWNLAKRRRPYRRKAV